MSEEINEVCIKTYDDWLKYYKNATKEQVIEDLTRDVQYFADAVKDIEDLQQKVEQLEKENIKQKEIIENLTTMTVCGDKKQIKNTAQYKLEQLESIIKEAIEYVYKHIQEYDVDGTFTNLDEFDFIASPQTLLNILNKGDKNE